MWSIDVYRLLAAEKITRALQEAQRDRQIRALQEAQHSRPAPARTPVPSGKEGPQTA